MDELTNYLYDPINHGVVVAKMSIEDVPQTIESLRTAKKEESSDKSHVSTISFMDIWLRERRAGSLVRGLNRFTNGQDSIKPEYDKKLASWAYTLMETKYPIENIGPKIGKELQPMMTLQFFKENVFGPDVVMSKIDDIVHITESEISSQLIMELTSIRKSGTSKYLELIKLLPFSRKQYSVISDPFESHSSHYAYEPFVGAADMWLSRNTTKTLLPKYLTEYLEAAVNYIRREEWRTSITLSAITVESIFAELYEEEFHRNAPDNPLGAIYKEISDNLKEKRTILEPVDAHVERVNNARIAAVHRGSRQVSQRESIDALRGAVRAVIWYYFIDSNRRHGQFNQ